MKTAGIRATAALLNLSEPLSRDSLMYCVRQTLGYFNILPPPHVLFSLLVLKFEHFLWRNVDCFIVTLGGGLT